MSLPLDRRTLLRLGGLLACGAALPGCSATAAESAHTGESAAASAEAGEGVTAQQALDKLRYGNRRFAGGNAIHPDEGSDRREEIAAGQHPFAIILSCVDSRVPPELIFDEGFGNLLVIRSAGQVVDHAVLGSIQFGVHELAIPLIMVLGHSGCGAVTAAADAVEHNAPASGSDIDTLIAAIRPSVEEARAENPKNVVELAVRKNVNRVLTSLSKAAVLAEAMDARELSIVGGYYDLTTGKVEFPDE